MQVILTDFVVLIVTPPETEGLRYSAFLTWHFDGIWLYWFK